MKLLVVPAVLLCLLICGIGSTSAADDAAPSGQNIEDGFAAKPKNGTAATQPRIWECEASGKMDVIVLKNGNCFEGLILGETSTQITLARYSNRVASPHILRIGKSDIVGIERLKPERRASLETQVRELLDNTRLARQQAEMARWQQAEAAAWQQLSDAAVAFLQTTAAVERQTRSMRTQIGDMRGRSQASRTAAASAAWSSRQAQTGQRLASAPTPRVRAAGKG